jgi:HEAT repeat protein
VAGGVPPNSREPYDDPPPNTGGTTAPDSTGDEPPVDPDPATETDSTSDDLPAPSAPTGGGTPPTIPGGGTSTAARPGRKGGNVEELRSWRAWWRVQEERFLKPRLRLREAEARAATAPGTATDVRDGRARDAIRDALRDREWTVRSAAAVALGRIGSTDSFHDLVALHTTRKADVRRSAGIGVGLLREPLAAERVGAVLFDVNEEESVRCTAALGLGLMGGAEAAAVLDRFLAPSRDAARASGLRRTALVEESAVVALGMTGHAPAGELLLRLASDPRVEDRARAFAHESLARLMGAGATPHLVRGLRGDAEVVRRSCAAALGNLPGVADATTVAALARVAAEDRDASTRRFALLSLGLCGAGEPALSRLVLSCPSADRPFAVLAAGVGRCTKTAPTLRAMLATEKEPELRGALAVALGLLGDGDSLPSLRAGAKDVKDPVLRGDFLTGLTLAGASDAPKLAREIIGTVSYDGLRITAAICLASAGDIEAVPALIRMTSDGCCPHCRGEAARTLGRIGSKAAIGDLAGLSEGAEDLPVRSESVWALGRILAEEELSRLARIGRDGAFPTYRGPLRSLTRM